MKRLTFAVLLAASTCLPGVAFADAPASVPAAKPTFSTANNDLGTLMDNPATRAVLNKYIAPMLSNPQIESARSMTLRQLQSFAADFLTDDLLAKIDADLAALPAK